MCDFPKTPETPDGLKAARIEAEAVARSIVLDMEQRHGFNSEEMRSEYEAGLLPWTEDIGRWLRALGVLAGVEDRTKTRPMAPAEREELRQGCGQGMVSLRMESVKACLLRHGAGCRHPDSGGDCEPWFGSSECSMRPVVLRMGGDK